MNNLKSIFFIAIIAMVTVIVSCGPKTTGSTTSRVGYSEDLSYLRSMESVEKDKKEKPAVSKEVDNQVISPVSAQNDILYAMRDTIHMYHANNKTIDGYSIQIYNGRSRDGALEVKDRVYKILPNVRPDIIYTQPSYRVKVGKYATRLEAHKDYMALKRDFPSAMIVPEKISNYFK